MPLYNFHSTILQSISTYIFDSINDDDTHTSYTHEFFFVVIYITCKNCLNEIDKKKVQFNNNKYYIYD